MIKGKGRHAVVFECLDSNRHKYAMKLFKEDSLHKVDKEIEALKHLRGGPNIIEFIDAVQGDKVEFAHWIAVRNNTD